MKRYRLLIIPIIVTVATLAMGLVSPRSASALVEKLTFDELTVEADTIVVGNVVNITSQWDTEHRHIYSLVTISVEDVIKGETAAGEVTIRVPGGEVDGIREIVSDAPRFHPEERMLVFLKQAEGGIFKVYGYSQGKYTIEDDKIVIQDMPLWQFRYQITEIMRSHGLSMPPVDKAIAPASEVLTLPEGMTWSETPPAEESASSSSGWQTIMSENFEAAFPGNKWTRQGNPTWGKTNYNEYAGSYCGWCARDGPAGLNPRYYHYPNNMNAWMVYGPFSLSDATDAELNFYFWSKSQYQHDYFSWFASIDGSHFYGTGATGNFGSWYSESFDLTSVYQLGNLCGEPQVWIAFHFESDSSVTDRGAFIDNISLRKYVGAIPQITSINPSSASAGTGTNVTIAGNNFGATQGDGYVWFFARPLGEVSYMVQVPVVSWSDTRIVATVDAASQGRISSGPVVVVTPAGMSNAYDFRVTFSYGGCKWPGANPTVEYLVNPNTPDTTGELAAVQSAFQAWNNVSDAYFNFTYGNATTATDFGFNGRNEIMWVNEHRDYVAANYCWWYTGDPATIIECDIVFNDADYDWSASGSPSSTEMDVRSVATHELGHSLQLLDLYGDADSEKTMYGFIATGETKKRTLHSDDITGIRWIYPGLVPSAWAFPYGPEVFPKYYDGQGCALPAGTEPPELLGVYYLDEESRQWKFFVPGLDPALCTLNELSPDKVYLIAVSGPCEWNVP